ncbi:hypothetical protein AB0A70_24255 [Streptomyces morookaense]|uniref:hypothetical protein n=1 Tax=Streptomyces morookaense TaxID=1970 RepID=UPI00340E8B3E
MNILAISEGPVSATTETTTTVMFGSLLAVFVVWGLSARTHLRRARILILVGASALAGFQDLAYYRLVGVTTFHSADAAIVYSAYSLQLPLWVLLGYSVWPAGIACIAVIAFDKNWSAGRIWRTYAALVALGIVGEALMIKWRLYAYAGPHPLRIFGVPFIWPLIYTAGFWALGLLVAQATLSLSGARRLALLPLGGSLMLGGAAFLGWPVLLGTGMNLPMLPTNLLATVSAAMTLTAFALLIRWSRRGIEEKESQ